MLPFLERLISSSPADRLLEQLGYSAYDELIEIHPGADRYEIRFHVEGKFFTPVLSNVFHQLLEYASTHMVHPEDREIHLRLMDGATMMARLRDAKPAGVLSAEIRYLTMNGNWRRMQHLLISGERYGLPEDTVYLYVFDIQEIQDREQGRFAVNEASEHMRGLLPDLLSENSFLSMCDDLLRQSKGQWCLIAIDIKHYKLFLELNGQEKGEHLLIRFGEILYQEAQERGGYACYRGQDDFGLCIPFEKARIETLFNRLRAEIDGLSGTSGFFPILGICLTDEDRAGATEMFNRAALTAEEIKDDLQYHIRVYDPKLHERHVEEFKLLSEFTEAMDRDEIDFYLQPQIIASSGRIVGAESLARWRRKDGTFVPPSRFIPVLEKYGVVTNLDIRIWEQVCAWLREMLDSGIRPVPISVNVSRIDLYSVDVAEVLNELTEKHQISHDLIKVEITESAYIEDSERVQETISRLRKDGFQILMDDFGSGYSSLNMLRSVKVDVIKLDAQFLRFSVGEERKGVNILESVISMTKSLDIPVIVEGVENQELVQFLKDMGCRYIQGFFYYHPMLKEEFVSLMQKPDMVDFGGITIQRNQQVHIREFLDNNIYSDNMLNNILGPVAFYCLKDRDVNIIRFNQQFVELIGLASDVLEARRYHIQNFFHPDDRERFSRMLEQAERDRVNGAVEIVRVFKPNGSIFWIQVHAYYLQETDEGKIFYGSCRDMTELQYINQELPGGYYRSSLQGGYEFLYISQTFLDMLGYSRGDIMNRFHNRMEEMIHPDDRETVRKESKEILTGHSRKVSPYRILHRDGTYRYVADQSRVTDQYGEVCWQSVIIDITEVMHLRNRMHLLEKYSTDCIVFIHNIRDLSSIEIACYGLEESLGMDENTFRQMLVERKLHIQNMDGDDLYEKMLRNYDSLSRWNGLYLLTPKEGHPVKCHVRFSRIMEKEQGVECIISLTAATVS